MTDPAIHQWLSESLTERLGKPADVFWAVREVRGKLRAGYWYRVWENERREKWILFGFLAGNDITALERIAKLVEGLNTGIPQWDAFSL